MSLDQSQGSGARSPRTFKLVPPSRDVVGDPDSGVLGGQLWILVRGLPRTVVLNPAREAHVDHRVDQLRLGQHLTKRAMERVPGPGWSSSGPNSLSGWPDVFTW
jgi:hypothetical protein